MKKLLGVVVIAFAAFYLVTQPQGAADAVRAAMNACVAAFDAVVTFLTALFR